MFFVTQNFWHKTSHVMWFTKTWKQTEQTNTSKQGIMQLVVVVGACSFYFTLHQVGNMTH